MDALRMSRRRLLLLPALPLLAQCGGGGDGLDPGAPPPDPPAIEIIAAFPQLQFDNPLYFSAAPGDAQRVFVVTQGGLVHVFANDPGTTTTSVFLDLGARVSREGNELGLLGLAFDPGYAGNGYFYVNYNPAGGQRRTVIARFRALDADTADATSETELLSFEQPYSNHNGGWLGFGGDGHLYIASGDGGSANDPENYAQRLDTPLGKILRIDADGGVPADNPFVGQAGARPEIWAYGLRNPFRASFDRATGALWAADVGQGAREEINVVTRGGNYGWRKFEGTRVNTADPDPGNAIAPVHEYARADGRCSVIGGYVYNGAAIPALKGHYLFADFCSGELWSLDRSGGGVAITPLGTVPGRPTSFGEDGAGELYLTSFDGRVYKIVPAP